MRRRVACRDFLGLRLFRHDDPCNRIGKQTDTGHYRRDEPYQPDQGDIEIKILCHAGADSSNLAVGAWAHQAPASRRATDPFAAVSTMTGVILDYFAAIVTVHGSLLTFVSLRSSLFPKYARRARKVPWAG